MPDTLTMQPEVEQPSIYSFLKENGLTDKSEQDFYTTYSDSTKAKDLHDFFVENKLTDKDFNSFYSDNLASKEKPAVQGEQPLTYMQKRLREETPEVYQENGQVKQPEQPKEEQGFFGKLGSVVGNSFMTGMNNLNSWAADAPGFIYDLAGAPFRAVGLNVPTSKDFQDTPLENISDYYRNNAKEYEKRVEQVNPSRNQGVIGAFENGDIEGGILNLSGSISESAPASIAMMLSGGATAPTILGGAAIFGAGKAQEIDENSPEMNYDKGRIVAALNGTLEGIFETYLGSGAVGKSLAGLIRKEGTEVAQQQVKRSLSTIFADMITKNPWLAPLGEGFEEVGTQLSQNFVDKYSGYKPNIKLTDGVGDAMLAGIGMGGIHGAVIGLAKTALEQKQQPTQAGSNKTSKPVSPDSGPQFTVDQRQTKEAELRQFAEGLTNAQTGIIQTVQEIYPEGTDNKFWFVALGQETDRDGSFMVVDEQGNQKLLTKNQLAGGIQEISVDDFVNNQLSAFDQQEQAKEYAKNNQMFVDGKVLMRIPNGAGLNDQGTAEYWLDENNDPVEIPIEKVQQWEQLKANNPQVTPNIVTRVYGKTEVSGVKDEQGNIAIQEPATEENAISLKNEVEQATGGNATVQATEIPSQDPTLPKQYQLTIVPQKIDLDAELLGKQPQNNESVTGAPSQDNGLKIDQSNTQPSYTFKGQPIDKKKAISIINIAADLNNPDKLTGLQYANDKEVDALIEKHFPKPKAKFKVGAKNYDEESALTFIDMADTPEELAKLKIENIEASPAVGEALKAKFELFNQVKLEEQLRIEEQAKVEKAKADEIHNKLVRDVNNFNSLSDAERRKADTAPIVRQAANLGYIVKYDGGKIIVTDRGKEIGYRGRNTPITDIESHKALTDYPAEVQEIAKYFLSPMLITGVDLKGLTPARANQAILDIQAGKKTVDANYLLDQIENIHNTGIVKLKSDRKTGFQGAEVPLSEYMALINEDMTPEEESLATLIPDDVAMAIFYEQLSPEILDQFENLIFTQNESDKTANRAAEKSVPNSSESKKFETSSKEISEKLTEEQQNGVDSQLFESLFTEKNLQKEKHQNEETEKSSQNTDEKPSEPVAETPAGNGSQQEENSSPEVQGEGNTQGLEENVSDPISEEIAQQEVNTNPSDAQKEAGNYKKAHITVQGMDISIENPKGSVRSGIDEDGKAWEHTMENHYGYFKRTEGKDGDHVDVFIGDNPESNVVFIVDQVSPETGKFDEHKVMLGFDSKESAIEAYRSNYAPDWRGLGNISEMPIDKFKSWLNNESKTKKPVHPGVVEFQKILEQKNKSIPEVENKELEIKFNISPEFAQTIAEAQAGRANEANKKRAIEYLQKDIKRLNDLRESDGIDIDALNKAISDRENAIKGFQKQSTPLLEAKETTVFKKDDAMAAIERLKKKLGGDQNVVNEPESNYGNNTPAPKLSMADMMDAAQVAGYFIESGNIGFADYSKAMVDAIGEGIKPYLKGLYENIRQWPGMEQYEPQMTSYDEVRKTDIEQALNPEQQKPEVDRSKPLDTVLKEASEKKQKEKSNVKSSNKNTDERSLQRNNKRVFKPELPSLFDRVEPEQRTGGSTGLQGAEVSRPNGTEQQSTGREGNVLPGNADVLKIEPALVDFNAEDNDTRSFNPTQKYNDNIKAIETLISLISEKRKATAQEKEILSRYVGFGGLKDVLLNPDNAEGWTATSDKYRPLVKRIIELSDQFDQVTGTKGSLNSIKGSILNAHYTSSNVIRSIYEGLHHLGFNGGRILEPSAGIGNFVTFMPNAIKGKSNITAVELDDLTGHILKYLHDDVNVKVKGIQDAGIPNNSQDLVISNIPFGNYKIFDKAFKGEKEQFQNRIHNYFFAKAVDMAREGGLIAFVTSKGVLDAPGNENLRRYLDQHTEFLGAVRLPDTAFKNNANTEVVTDIIFLRKNSTIDKNSPNFINVFKVKAVHRDGAQQEVNVNQYFVDHPENMLGNIVAGGLYSRDDYTVENKTGYDLTEAIKKALPSGVYKTVTSDLGSQANDSQETIDAIKEGNIELTGDRLVRKEEGQLVEIKINEPASKIQHYIRLRNTLMNLIYSEYLGKGDVELNAVRRNLNNEYDSFVKKYGRLDKSATKIAKQDADGYNVLSLEVKDKPDGKADIFRKRTIQPLQNKLTAESIDEAIVVSLYEHAAIDIERIAQLMNLSIPEVLEKAKGKIFEQPTGGFVTRDEYLSGNVKKKLKEAQQAVTDGNQEFQYNVDELQNVIPKDIPAMNIEARLGSRWIPAQVFSDFAKFLFNTPNAEITYIKSIDDYSHNGRLATVEATSKYGTYRRNGADILIDALRLSPPKIYDKIDDKQVLNVDETAKANEKYEEIRQVFEDWVYRDGERRDLLGRIYNDKYNTSIARQYNGDHLNISGINGVSLRKHQKDAIWMLLQNNGGIIDHLVGAGKTYVMVAGTMEMKRTGIAKKPMIIALKSTIPQIVESYRSAFPMAKVLAPLEKDFTKENRNKLFAQIANNEWDCIIMSHENYGKIPHELDIQQKFIEDEMAEVESERAELDAAGNKQALKGLEIRLKNLEARLEKLNNLDKDNSITFEQMGIDHVMVDESQQFKNLAYVTKQRDVAGLSKAEGSKRAFNLFIGVRYLQQKYGADKGITFLSGTPISNSMVEMYLLLKYLRPNKMKELGFNSFDAWATTFASPSSDIEFTVTGNFKQKNRFREFINVPELSMLYREIADIRTDANTPLDKPKMKGEGYSVVNIKMSKDQKRYGRKLMRFAKTKDGSHIGMVLSDNQKTAAMLLATNLSSKMAIDMRLINPSYAYDPNGKIAKLVENVFDTYNRYDDVKGTQLIFSDLGTPKNRTNRTALLRDYMEDELGTNMDTLNEIFGDPNESGYKIPAIGVVKDRLRSVLELSDAEIETIIEESENSVSSFNVYDEVKNRLIEKGIPENHVVFIHDYNSQRAKQNLFKEVQQGNIRIVLGSTQKLGTGVNVQDRIVAMHHLDVPWTPAAMEQRNGRGIRQGNWVAKQHLNNELPAYAYATELTLDAYKYQLLDTKQRFLDQVKSGDTSERVAKESDGDSESGVGYAELVAMMSGNKDFLLKNKLEQKIEKLKRSKRNFLSEVYEATGKVKELTNNIPQIEQNIEKTKQNISELTDKMQVDEHGKMIVADVDGKKLTTIKDEKGKDRPAERTDYGKLAIEIIENKLGGSASIGAVYNILKIGDIKIIGRRSDLTGFQIGIEASNGERYSVNFSHIPGIFLNNIQKAIENIPNIKEQQEKYLQRSNTDLISYQELLKKGDTWEKEQELTDANNELKEVNKRLNESNKFPAQRAKKILDDYKENGGDFDTFVDQIESVDIESINDGVIERYYNSGIERWKNNEGAEESLKNVREKLLNDLTTELDKLVEKELQASEEQENKKSDDDKIRIGDLSFTIGKESFVTLAEAKNTKTGNSAVAVRINEQLSNNDYARIVKPLIERYFGEWNSSNKVILFDDFNLANNFKIAVERDFPALNENYQAPEGYKVQESPVQTPVSDRSIPLMDVLDNGKQVTEIKKTQEQEELKKSLSPLVIGGRGATIPVKESASSKLMPVEEYRHTKTGQILYNVKINGRSDLYDHMVTVAKRHNPYDKRHPFNTRYSKGFLFEKKEDAERFRTAINGTPDNTVSEPQAEYGKRKRENNFYSPTEKALNSIQQNKGTVEQFKAMLLKNGAKQAEMDWMGFDESFPDGKQSVTKSDIQNWIDQNKIEVKEVQKGETRLDAKDIERKELKNDGFWHFYFNDGTESTVFDGGFSREDLVEMAVKNRNKSEGDNTKFSQYTEPGGSNYKELLLTMPNKPILAPVSKEDAYYNLMSGFDVFNEKGEKVSQYSLTQDIDNTQKFFSTVNKAEFKSSHYDEPNILAHIRFNERTGENGERVLFVEEFQSDWAQKGKKEGFKQKPLTELPEGFDVSQDEKKDGTKYWEVDGEYQGFNIVARSESSKEEAIERALDKINHKNIGIPNMPFSKTDQWVNLAFRRMMLWAVENESPASSDWIKVTKPQSIRQQIEQNLWGELASIIPLKVMDVPMLLAAKNDKVRRFVIEFIPVDVMNMLSDKGISPDKLFSKDNMVGSTLSVVDRSTIARGLASALQLSGTRLRAALNGILSSQPSGRNKEVIPTISASDLDPSVIVSLLSPSRIYGIDGNVSFSGLSGADSTTKFSVSGSNNGRISGEPTTTELANLLNWHDNNINSSSNSITKFMPPKSFDRLAWASGAMQAARYDLSKQVDEIIAKKDNNDNYALEIKYKGSSQPAYRTLKESELEDNVGKELASKIIENENNKSYNFPARKSNVYAGLDLKVGGSGMKAFYDAIIPSAANKLGKVFGARVEETSLNVPSTVKQGSKSDVWDNVKYEVAKNYGGGFNLTFIGDNIFWMYREGLTPDTTNTYNSPSPKVFDTVKEAENFAKEYIKQQQDKSNSVSVQSLPVTESMKESVLQNGVSLFEPKSDYLRTQEANLAYGSEELHQTSTSETAKGIRNDQGIQPTDRGLDSLPGRNNGIERGNNQSDSSNSINEPKRTYKTKEGETLQYNLFSDTDNGSGAADLQRQADRQQNPTLRKLRPGERSSVEMKYSLDKNFVFDGRNRIESTDDVAYLFKNLESKSVENMFACFVKDGKPTIVHMSMGNAHGTVMNFNVLADGISRFSPDKVYLIHNHPSGNLIQSQADMDIHNKAIDAFGEVIGEHIIINLTSGEYATFRRGTYSHRIESRPTEKSNSEKQYKVYKFDKQVFKQDAILPTKVTQPDDVAAFISSQRFTEGNKLSALMLDRNNNIKAYLHLSDVDFTSQKAVNELTKELQAYVGRFGSSSIILSGTRPTSTASWNNLRALKAALKNSDVALLDYISNVRSAYSYDSTSNDGLLDPQANYGKSIPLTKVLEEGKRVVQEKKSGVSLGENKPMTEKEFYKKYHAIHKDVRTKGASKDIILTEGFNEGFNVNAMPFYKGYDNQTDIMHAKYGAKEGDFVWLLPKEGVIDGRNGYKTKQGYIPSSSDGFFITDGTKTVYENYLIALEKDKQLPNTILINGVPRPTLNSNGLLSSIMSGETPVTESTPYSYVAYAKSFTDLLKSEPFRLHGFSGLDIPSQRVMLHYVFSFGSNDKVLNSIVKFIPIDVVNILSRRNTSPNKLFHNISMFEKLFTVNPNEFIPPAINSVRLGLIDAITSVRTKIPNLDQVFPNQKGGSATGTNMGDEVSFLHEANIQKNNQINYTGNNGDFNPDDPNILHEPEAGYGGRLNLVGFLDNAGRNYREKKRTRREVAEVIRGVRDFYQDHDMPIRRMEDEVTKLGGKLNDSQHPYRDMNLSFGRMEELFKSFVSDKMKPILKTVSEISKTGMARENILPYIICKRATELNPKMREKEALEFADNTVEKPTREQIEEDIDGSVQDEYKQQYDDAYNSKLEELSTKDYSGVMGFDPERNFENPDELAQSIVDEFEAQVPKELTDKLWTNIKYATTDIVKAWQKGNMISEEQANELILGSKYYVPLRGWREGAAKQLAYIKGEGFSRSMQKAEGRRSFADNPLAYIHKVAFQAIGEQVDNEVKKSLLNLVTGNYGDDFNHIYELKKAYYVKTILDDGSEGWMLNVDPATGEIVRPSKEMFDAGEATTKIYNQYERLRTPSQAREHEVLVKTPIGDMIVVFKDKYLQVAQAMNKRNRMYIGLLTGNIKDATDWNGPAVRTIGNINNFIKANLTSRNIVFPFTNILRDAPEASLTAFIKGESGIKVIRNMRHASAAFARDLAGKFNPANKYDQYLKEFRETGGTTGYTHQKDIEQINKELERTLRRIERGGMARIANAWSNTGKAIETWSDIFETTTRLAVYISSRERGKSARESASDAKEYSVNFNRKGKITKALDALYAFFNVSVQSLQKNGSLAKKYPARFSMVAASFMLLGFLEALLNDATSGDGDDDDYYNLNEYVRENYMVLPAPWDEKEYIRLPLPQFWRSFKSFGSILYDTAVKGKMTTQDATIKAMGNFIASLTPIDLGGLYVDGKINLSPVVPTITRPFAELAANRDYMGYTIAKEPFTKEQEKLLADSGLGKNNVNPAIKFFTDYLAKTGGIDGETKFYREDGETKKVNPLLDLNPSKIDHVVKGFLGGTYKVAADAITTISQALSKDEEVDFNNIPFVNSFIRKTPASKWKIIEQYYNLKADNGFISFDALKRDLFNREDKGKFKELATDIYLNKYQAVLERYDQLLSQKMQFMDYKTAEGSESVLSTMKDAIEAINDIKKEFNRK